MVSLSDSLYSVVRQSGEYTSAKVIILKNKTNDFPQIHVMYTLAEYKSSSSVKAILKFYPLVFLTANGNHELLQNTKNYSYKDTLNLFQISINTLYQTSAISGNGDGFIIYPDHLKGFGLGTFAFYTLINWAKEKGFGDIPVNKQPIGGDEKEYLSRFMLYVKNGLSLSAEAVRTQGKSGEYFASSLNNLTPYLPDNLDEHLTFENYDNYLSNINKKLKSALKHQLNKNHNLKSQNSIFSKLFR